MDQSISGDDLHNLALRQLSDYRENNPGTCFSDAGFSLGIKAAYDLQDAISRLRMAAGENVIGYKVGCTGPGTTAQFGMQGPIRGTLFSGEALDNRTVIDPDEFCHLAIEGEMAFCIGIDGQIDTAFPVIELHNFVFRSAKKSLSELIANNGLNAGIVLPDIDWQQSDKHIKESGKLSLVINDAEIGTTGLWPNQDGPGSSLKWLSSNLRDSGLSLVPGQIVLAGTSLGLYPVKSGDVVKVSIDDRLAVECKITDSHGSDSPL